MSSSDWDLFLRMIEMPEQVISELTDSSAGELTIYQRLIIQDAKGRIGGLDNDVLLQIEIESEDLGLSTQLGPWIQAIRADRQLARFDIGCIPTAMTGLSDISPETFLPRIVLQARGRLSRIVALARVTGGDQAEGDALLSRSISDFRNCELPDEAELTTVIYLVQSDLVSGNNPRGSLRRVEDARDSLKSRESFYLIWAEVGLALLYFRLQRYRDMIDALDRCEPILAANAQLEQILRVQVFNPLRAMGQVAIADGSTEANTELNVAIDDLRRGAPWLVGLALNVCADLYTNLGMVEVARDFFDRAEVIPAFGWADPAFRRRLSQRMSILDGNLSAVSDVKDETNAMAAAGRLSAASTFAMNAARDCERIGDQAGADMLRSLADEISGRDPAVSPHAGSGLPYRRIGQKVTIRLMAPEVEVERSGRRLSLSNSSARLLLTLLTSEGPMTDEQMIDMLWPEADTSTGRNRLASAIHRLRAQMGLDKEELLVRRGATILVDCPDDWEVDWYRLRSAATLTVDEQVATVLNVTGAIASAQFAYDEAFSQLRHTAVAIWVKTASSLVRLGHLTPDALEVQLASLELGREWLLDPGSGSLSS